MSLALTISTIKSKPQETGIVLNPPASTDNFVNAETKLRLELPSDFKEFYSLCNGLEYEDDSFSMLSLDKLFLDSDFGQHCVVFAEHKVYSDVWVMKKLDDDMYEILCDDGETILTNSLGAFLERVVLGGVTRDGGLFGWYAEIIQ